MNSKGSHINTKVFLLLWMVLAMLFGVYAAFGQDKPDGPGKRHHKKKLADAAFKENNFYTAIDLYEELHAHDPRDPDNVKLAWKIAESYRLVREYANAAKWYKQILDTRPGAYPLAKYYYADMLMRDGQYVAAKKLFEEFRKSYRGFDNGTYKSLAKQGMANCDFGMEAMRHPGKEQVLHLGKEVNAPHTDLAPVAWGKDRMVYTSMPSDTLVVLDKQNKETDFLRLRVVQREGNSWSSSQPFRDGPFNMDGMHTANGALSADGNRFYFTRCALKENIGLLCEIFVSTKLNGAWQSPVKLPESVNVADVTATQPALGHDRNGDLLYFVSNRSGGMGGLDIWSMPLDKEGMPNGQATNLGRKINTEQDERTPFYDPKSGSLYFSSDGHTGMGGLDIFVAVSNGKRFQQPENMGYPVNSAADDFNYTRFPEPGEAFLASNRPGTYTLRGATCCDDIFLVSLPIEKKEMTFELTVNITDKESLTPISGSKVSLYKNHDGRRTLVDNDTTSSGSIRFFHLDTNSTYEIKVSTTGYLSDLAKIDPKKKLTLTGEIDKTPQLDVDIGLDKLEKEKVYKLEHVYYDFDRDQLRPGADRAIEKLITILEENPTIIVEIGSHTDSKGDAAYNKQLSQRRAETVMKVLIQRGIDPKRIKAKGYGESSPVAPNTLSDGRDNPAGRKLNRRTEFKVVGEINLE